MPADQINRRDDRVKFDGRILFLTADTSLIRSQLEAQDEEAKALEAELVRRLANDDLPLMDNISTDEITPGWVCYYYDETLARYCLVGLRGNKVKPDAIQGGRLVSAGLAIAGCALIVIWMGVLPGTFAALTQSAAAAFGR